MLRAALAEIERQRLIIAALQRNRFGRRSEQLDDATVQHGVEDLEQSVAEQTAAVEAAMPPAKPAATGAAARPPRTEPAKRNRGALPAHLPRVGAGHQYCRTCHAAGGSGAQECIPSGQAQGHGLPAPIAVGGIGRLSPHCFRRQS